MTPDEFRAWRTWMGYDKATAAEALGVTWRSIDHYESGDRKVSRTLELLCEQLSKGRRKRKSA